MSVHIGTSGWAYKEWKGSFYPQKLPQTKFLEHYSTVLTACEVNATFYRIQSPELIARWRDMTPEGFRFAVKAHRMISFARSLKPEGTRRDILGEFLTSIESFGDRLGPLLLQFSARRPEDNDVGFKALLAMLPEGVRFAVDLNHETWRVPEVEAAVIAAGGTLCLSHRDGPPPQVLPDGPIGYARLRAERYDDNEREALLELLRREGKERDIYIFAKHEAAPPDDPHVGAGLARWLTEELG